MNPEEELKKLNKGIKQLETVLRSTKSSGQRERVASELKKLKRYREKIKIVNIIDNEKLEDNVCMDEFAGFPFLKNLLSGEGERHINDKETYYISIYMLFFESEFLPLLSETRLKLDFKYSLERDSFYHRFQSLLRRLKDLIEELKRVDEGTYRVEIEEEMRKRIFKMKRSLSIELDRFFKDVNRFSSELIKDLNVDSLKCLNGEDAINFDPIEGERYLKGMTVKNALKKMFSFSREVIDFLDIPDIKVKE